LDYTLSFHIGVMARVQAQRKGAKTERVGDRLAAAFRRWEQAAEALEASKESEEVQAVGMRCRECLIAFVRPVADPKMVPAGETAPKAGDVIHWTELIAEAVARGSTAAEIRGYLKTLAKSTWQLVSWLTHASNAVRYDGMLAVDATYAVLNAYGAAIIRHERPTPDRCPRCNSLRIQIVDEPELESGLGIACESCGVLTDSAEQDAK
jgi:predicted Zn-ribbon and HTH transcriptional regulator